jgi:hypothetical protein
VGVAAAVQDEEEGAIAQVQGLGHRDGRGQGRGGWRQWRRRVVGLFLEVVKNDQSKLLIRWMV